ncbi:major facilitator superfamily domain-containing protein [Aspergillus candidus]|uniref:Major facilitator superfamily domain-containing protein n=1 Tax=Aspergillus candidus TaxID=41067 RepID=A0A2I2FAJ6_ASPCN|nr:major facilitator superfamily domain-containing protein [Aspergillus candidus]PLB37651.1 major facilitator superfamily domain-containing protein [Aspergillus candidus]
MCRNHTDDNDYLAGLIDAAPWLSASVIGAWLSDQLQEATAGRRPALFLSSIFCAAFALGSARCESWVQLLICRICLGIGIGAKASIAPVFAAEAAADHLRGRLLIMWQFFDAGGIFLGFLTVWIVDHSWRALLASAAIPALIMLFLVFLCPESPRLLIRRGDYHAAFGVLCQLRPTEVQAARDLFYIHSQLQKEAALIEGQKTPDQQAWRDSRSGTPLEHPLDQAGDDRYLKMIQKSSYPHRVGALWKIPRNRNACIAAFIVMASQQLCGINVLSFYSSKLYDDVHQPTNKGREPATIELQRRTRVAWLNFGFGLANFLCTLPAFRLIDRYSRRQLLLTSLGAMFFCLVAIGGFYEIDDVNIRLGPIATFTVVLFNVAYGVGAGPIPFTFSAEAFPLSYRGMHHPSPNLYMSHLIGLLVYRSRNELQCHDVIAFILVFLFVPSASSKYTLEEMNSIFKHKMVCHVRWHLSVFCVLRGQERGDFDDFCVCEGSGE